MNKLLCTVLILLNFSICYSQEFEFAVINDKDGYVNVRSSNEIKENNVIDKLENGFVISHFGAVGNWTNVDYEKNGKQFSGFIYKNRIKGVSEFTKIPQYNIMKNKIILCKNDVEIIITDKLFDKTKHTFNYYKECPNLIKGIDSKEIFGTDGNIPKREYNSITITIGSSKVDIPKKSIENLYEPNLDYTIVNYDEKNKTLYIQSLNSDGAGGYAVIWKIEKGKFKQRITSIPF